MNRKKIYIGVLLIILLWAVSAILISVFFEADKRGVFGDMFGAINALFSGLALFGIIISLLLQQKQLKHQQNELFLQREELKLTRKEYKINRITTILFKQNQIINDLIRSFYYTIEKASDKYLIDEFVYRLDRYQLSNNENIIKNTLISNEHVIHNTAMEVEYRVKLFDDLLVLNSLDVEDELLIRKLFIGNMDAYFTRLIDIYIKALKKEITSAKEKDKMTRIEELRFNTIKRLHFILNYAS